MNLKIQVSKSEAIELYFIINDILSESRTNQTSDNLLAAYEVERFRAKIRTFALTKFRYARPGQCSRILVRYPVLLVIYSQLSKKPSEIGLGTPFVRNLLATIKTCFELQD